MKKSLIEKFFQLVRIDSPSGKEGELKDYLIAFFNKLNLPTKVDRVGNLLVVVKGKTKPLLLSAHMDTVEPGRGIKPKIKDGFITSLGNTILGADNKASLAAILQTVEELVKEKNHVSLELLFTIKEETGGGIEFFPFSWLKAKKGLVFDAAFPLGGIVLRSPFIENFAISVVGKAAHSSSPEEGINSLFFAQKLLKKIRLGYLDRKETTINIGLLHSGTAINTIPERTEIKGEIRSYKKEKFNHWKNYLKKISQSCQSNQIKLKTKLNFSGFCPGYVYQKSNLFIVEVKNIIEKLIGKSYFLERSGVSDANIFFQKGLKVINLTDGVIDPHTTQERIKINDLILLQKMMKNLILNLSN